MNVFNLVMVIITVGIGLWLVNAYIPMEARVKQILNAVVIVLLVIWLLKVFGFWQRIVSLHL